MRVAVEFNTSSDGWGHSGYERRMTTQVVAWEHDERDAHPLVTDGNDKADGAGEAGADGHSGVPLGDEAVASDGDE